jgi:thymidine kinase
MKFSQRGLLGVLFEPIPRLHAVAEEVTKLLATCMRCGNPDARATPPES